MYKKFYIYYLLVFFYFPIFADDRRPAVSVETTEQTQESKDKPQTNETYSKSKIELAKIGNEIISLFRIKNWKGVNQKLKEILSIDKNALEYDYFKGAYLYSTEDYKSAITFLNQAIEKNSNHDPSYYLLGMIHGKFGNWEKAIYYIEIANGKTYNPFYSYNLAAYYFLQKKFSEAKSTSLKTLELKTNYHEAKILLLRSLIHLHQIDEALNFCRTYSSEKILLEEFFEVYAKVLFESKNDYKKITELLLPLKNISLESKRILAYSLFKENRLVESSAIYKQIFFSNLDREIDFLTYLEILFLLKKDSEAELLLKNSIGKRYFEREKYLLKFDELKIETDIRGSIYQPIPWR